MDGDIYKNRNKSNSLDSKIFEDSKSIIYTNISLKTFEIDADYWLL